MSKHSRGPWYWNINAADYLELRTAEEGNPIIGQWGDWPVLSKADADLIPEAPEMLELLRSLEVGLCSWHRVAEQAPKDCWLCRRNALLRRIDGKS